MSGSRKFVSMMAAFWDKRIYETKHTRPLSLHPRRVLKALDFTSISGSPNTVSKMKEMWDKRITEEKYTRPTPTYESVQKVTDLPDLVSAMKEKYTRPSKVSNKGLKKTVGSISTSVSPNSVRSMAEIWNKRILEDKYTRPTQAYQSLRKAIVSSCLSGSSDLVSVMTAMWNKRVLEEKYTRLSPLRVMTATGARQNITKISEMFESYQTSTTTAPTNKTSRVKLANARSKVSSLAEKFGGSQWSLRSVVQKTKVNETKAVRSVKAISEEFNRHLTPETESETSNRASANSFRVIQTEATTAVSKLSNRFTSGQTTITLDKEIVVVQKGSVRDNVLLDQQLQEKRNHAAAA